jgi:tRNA pseudouridine55 synthase
MLGVVNLDKPVGPTSHDMVALMRRLTGQRRIGHAGTLDPLASGVLPILVGAATRLSEELTGGSKRYDAVIRLGQSSATDDAEGPLTPGDGPPPSPEAVADALTRFVGRISQRPPRFSARKAGGVIAHRAARAGVPLELPARDVLIERLDLLSTTAGDGWLDVRVDLRCGPGTYVRSLARDLGEALGSGGHLQGLRRTEAAGLRIEDARTPDVLQELATDGRLAEAILPVAGLLSLPRIELDPSSATRFVHGSTVVVGDAAASGRMLAFAGERLLGVGTIVAGQLKPDKVLASETGA